MINEIENWEERLLKIIQDKHCGLGLCDFMFHKTIKPFVTDLLSQERTLLLDSAIERIEGEKRLFTEDFECGGCGVCEACLLHNDDSAEIFNSALDKAKSILNDIKVK